MSSTTLDAVSTPTRDATLATASGGEFLTFRIGGEEYGIEILRVQEIRSYEPPMRIANAPPNVIGVINLRGAIVPLVDLRLKLGCAQAACDDSTVVIVLNLNDQVVGAVVDSVSDVTLLNDESIQPAPRLNGAFDTQFITGIGQLDKRMLILLDIGTLLAGAELRAIGAGRHDDA